MEKRVLGKDLEVSEIGLGCMGMSHAYGTVSTEKEAEELIAKAIDEGCTFFDTAEIYGTTEDPHHNEKLLGEVLRPYVELVSTTVDNWDSYDTVYIGYPIWWGIAVWPGHVIKDMKEKCKGAIFVHEMKIQFDSMGKDHLETPENVIIEWIGEVKADLNK